MLNLELIKGITTSFVGASLAVFVAGIIWFIKTAYEKHRKEVLALAKFERIFANNITLLKDNFGFIDEWITASKSNRPYTCCFGDLIIDEEESYKLSNLKLINKILSLNYKLKRTNLDLNNIYKKYWEIIFKIDSIEDPKEKMENLQKHSEGIIKALGEIQGNYQSIRKDIIDVVATIRVASGVRFHSLFGYTSLLFRDVFPKITDKKIKNKTEALIKELKDKGI